MSAASPTLPPQPCCPDALTAGSTGLVSVVIPCFRQAHFLGDSIESVLRQTYRRFEVLVVNDGSPDDTATVASRYDIRYVEQEHAGLAAARNAGLQRALGEFVVFLDADDRVLPDALRINISRLQADPALAFVAGASRYIARDGTPLDTSPPQIPCGDLYEVLLRRNRIRTPAMVMFRRAVFERVGDFDTGLDACADYDVYLRICRQFPAALHDELVAEYRRHETNMSLNPARMLRQFSIVMRRQRKYVHGSNVASAAVYEGLRNMQEYYGDQLADRIRARVRAGKELPSAIADAGRLFALYPRGLFIHMWRKLRRWSNYGAPDMDASRQSR